MKSRSNMNKIGQIGLGVVWCLPNYWPKIRRTHKPTRAPMSSKHDCKNKLRRLGHNPTGSEQTSKSNEFERNDYRGDRCDNLFSNCLCIND